jgi:hypothetical protein
MIVALLNQKGGLTVADVLRELPAREFAPTEGGTP